MNPEIIGMIAAILTTAAYVPQTIKVLKSKHTQDLSLAMFSMITAGIGIWFIYGVMIESPSIMIANGTCFILAGIILLMKLKHG